MSDMIYNKMQPVEIIRSLEEAGYQALYVGGFVRDSLLGLRPEDADIATSASPEQVVALFQDRAKLKLQGKQFGVVTVDGIEVAMFRGEAYQIPGKPDVVLVADFERDAARRDFTINAMGMTAAGEIIDPVGGQADLQAGLIRAVGDPDTRFCEDPARLLRAVTFAARFGFIIEAGTADAIRRHAGLTGCLPKERIAKEISKMLDRRVLHRGLALLRAMGLLPWVLPELIDLAGDDDDQWVRALQVVRTAETMAAPQAVVWATALGHCAKEAKHAAELSRAAVLRLQGGKSLASMVRKLVRWQSMRLPQTALHALRILRPLTLRFPTRPLLEGFIHDLFAVLHAEARGRDTLASRQRLDEINASQAVIERVLAVAPLYPREAQIDGAALGLEGPKAGHQITRLLYRAQMEAIDEL